MIRALIIIAVASFVLALGCFAGAAAIGGRELAANGWVWPEKWNEYGIRINDASEGAYTPDEVRDIPWTGGDTLQIDLQGDVNYVQGDEGLVRVYGPEDLIKYVALEDGRLFLRPESDMLSLGDRDRLRIEIVLPSVRRFVINGAPKLKISNYDQENLTVEVNGSGEAVVEGRTDRLAVTVSGSGEADLGAVQATDANIKVVGSGEAKASPTGTVQASIAGSGDIHLGLRPASLTSQVDGSGEVHQAD